jgi:CheY-like chemotaxis protein
MTKQVLDVGNCGPDHATLSAALMKHFAVEVFQADQALDALEILRRETIDLVLVNRKLDIDYSDGIEVIKQIKAEPDLAKIPVMLITNHDEYQQAALAAGADYGFGKLALHDAKTLERLSKFLS